MKVNELVYFLIHFMCLPSTLTINLKMKKNGKKSVFSFPSRVHKEANRRAGLLPISFHEQAREKDKSYKFAS